ncbi:hypothetical protein ACP70R_009259 [Stipagrostis hirtigluma subsp. patula]
MDIVQQGSSSRHKPNLKAYAKVDAIPPTQRYPGCIPVMVGITPPSRTTEQRMPVDLVVVLHVHEDSNVPKNWRKLLMEAVDFIVQKLDEKDRLAVLPYDHSLTFLAQRDALMKTPDQKAIRRDRSSLGGVLNSANTILYDRKLEDKERRAGHIIVISNSNEDTGSLLAWKFRSVHTFGFRDARNARTMHSISRNRGCTYAVFDDEHGQITKAFLSCINSITSAVATVPIEVKLKCGKEVVFSAIDTPGASYIISDDKKDAIIWPSAHLVDVPTNYVVYLSHQRQDDLTERLTVDVRYGNVSERVNLQVVTEGMDGSKEVAAEIVRSEAIRIISDIITIDENDREQLHEAADNLRQRSAELKSSDWGREASKEVLISRLAAEFREMEIRLYNNYFWLEYMLSWLSHQRYQLPLPQLFMENQSMDDPLLPLEIRGTIKGHQERLPVLMQLKAPEAGLAKVKRASVDMIAVLDASYGAKQMEQKTQQRMKLVIKAKEMEKEHNKAKEMFDKLQKWQKLLENAKDDKSLQKQEMKDRITQKRLEMNSIANKMNTLHNQIKETEKDLEMVVENTQQRLQLFNKALDLVMKKLSDKDRLAIIPVQFSVTNPATGLLKMSKQGRSKISATMNSLVDHIVQELTTATQTSHRMELLNKAKKQVQNCHKIATMLSSPKPTHTESQGMTSMTGHLAGAGGRTELGKALIDAAKILDERHGEEKDRVARIILISDSDDDSICKEGIDAKYNILAFGILATHNVRALYHIVKSSNGIYGILNDARNQITEDFTDCIHNITSIIAVDAKIELLRSHSSSAVLSTVESGRFRHLIHNENSSSILVDVLYAGTEMEFNVFVDNVREEDFESLPELLSVRVKWLQPMSRVEEKLAGEVVVVRSGAEFGRYKEGSSSGSSDSRGKLQLKAYAKVDANPPGRYRGCIPVMVGITPLPGAAEERAPLDLVLVLHVLEGCNVPKEWWELLKQAMDVIAEKLGDNDRLAVLPYDDSLSFLQRRKEASPQAIISNTSLREVLMSADLILHDRTLEDKARRTGHIIAISNSNEDIDSQFALRWWQHLVYTFGFRIARNARTMYSMSGNSGWTYAVLDDEHGHVTKAFLGCINNITSTVTTTSLEVKLKCDKKVVLSAIDAPSVSYIISDDKKVELSAVDAPSVSYIISDDKKVVLSAVDAPSDSYIISDDKKGDIIRANAHLVDAPTNFLVYLSYRRADDLARLFTVDVRYGTVSKKLNLEMVTEGMDGSKEVAAEMVRCEAIRIISDIITLDENDWEQLHKAADNLRQWWAELQSSNLGREAGKEVLISRLAAEFREMEIRLYNNYFWLEYMLSWLSHQRYQLPLPQLFMENQSMDDPLLQLKIRGTITGHQERLPVRMQLKAPEAGLAKVKRASIDLIVVLDASYGAKQMEKKTQQRLKLVIKALEMEEEHNKAKEMFDKLQKWQKLLENAKDDKSLQKQEMKDRITQKRLEMNSIANKMNTLHNQIKEAEEDLEMVVENTQQRLQLLNKALDLVMKKLSDKDRLAITPVQFSVTNPATGLLKMSKQGRSKISTTMNSLVDHIVQELTTASANNVATQTSHRMELLDKAKKQVQNCHKIATKLSSPNPTHTESQGMTSMTGHSADAGGRTELGKALMDAAKILDERRGEEKDRVARIILISDSDDDSICKEAIDANYIILAFGILATHNVRALYHIVKSSNGIYGILNDASNQITEDFTDCIHNITSIIAVDAKIELPRSYSSSAVLSTVESGSFRHLIHNENSSSILVDVLYAGTEMEFSVFVDNVREEDYERLPEILTVPVKWLQPMSRVEEKLEGDVVVVRNGAEFGRYKEGSSSGSSESRGKLQLKAYAKVDANPPERYRGCIPVMVGITPLPGAAEERAPLDLVLVLHVLEGCNVPKKWWELLKQAMDVIAEKLGDNDRLAVLPYDDSLSFLQRRKEVSPQAIISNTSLREVLVSADLILHDRTLEEKVRRTGHIIAISNSNEDIDSRFALRWRQRSVYTFGFRIARNARTMYSMSRNSGWTYAVLDDEHGHVTKAFLGCINGITSAVSTPSLEVKLKCDKKVVLSAIDAPSVSYIISDDKKVVLSAVDAPSASYIISDDKKVGIIWASAHLVDVPTNFIIYLCCRQQDDLTKMFTVDVRYGTVSDKLSLEVVDEGMDGSNKVAAEMVRCEAIRIISDIITIDENNWKQLHEAADNLRQWWAELESSDWGREAGKEGLVSRLATEM